MIQISPKQAEYIKNATHRWNIKMGATQSGKTYLDTCYLIPQRLLERKGKEGLNFIVGVTKETIERNVLSKMRALWGSHKISEINSKNRANLFGEMVYCIGAENKGRVAAFRGATAKYLYIDEFPDISEEVFSIFSSRLSLPYSCADMTGNPKTPEHWSENFIKSDKDIYFQRYKLYDNPFLTIDTIRNIERDYKDTVFFDRYVLGLPKRAEGIVFPMFADNPKPWIISPEEVPKQFRRVISGLDVGGNGSHHSMCCTGEGYDGNYYVLKCIDVDPVGTNMLDIENMVVDFCKDIENKYNCEVEFISSDWVDVVINSINDNTSYRCGKCYKPPLDDRPLTISRLFNTYQLKFVNGMCDPLIDELRNVVYDDKSDRAVIQDNGSMCIDCVDAFVYSFNNWNYITAN